MVALGGVVRLPVVLSAAVFDCVCVRTCARERVCSCTAGSWVASVFLFAFPYFLISYFSFFFSFSFFLPLLATRREGKKETQTVDLAPCLACSVSLFSFPLVFSVAYYEKAQRWVFCFRLEGFSLIFPIPFSRRLVVLGFGC